MTHSHLVSVVLPKLVETIDNQAGVMAALIAETENATGKKLLMYADEKGRMAYKFVVPDETATAPQELKPD